MRNNRVNSITVAVLSIRLWAVSGRRAAGGGGRVLRDTLPFG